MRLIETLRSEADRREAARRQDEAWRDEDPTRAPAPLYLGKNVTVEDSALPPDGRWLLVVARALSAKIAGVGKVHVADDAAYANALAENVAPLIVELMGSHDAFVAPATTAGKNIAPSNIENYLKESPIIGHALVFGEARPYCVAVLTLDAEITPLVAQRLGLPELSLAATGARVREAVSERERLATALAAQGYRGLTTALRAVEGRSLNTAALIGLIGRGPPTPPAASTAAAACSASSELTCRKAFSSPSTSAIRSRCAWVSSTEVMVPARSRSAICRAESRISWSGV